MQQAINSLARQIGAEVVSAVMDFYGNKHDVLVGLKNNGCQRGIGFDVDKDGSLTVHGDVYGQEQEFNRLKTLAQNYIKAYKVAQNALALCPTAKIQTKVLEKAVIMEVAV